MSYWTAERVERLITQWDRGDSFSEIAAQWGVSRGKISGKLNRLGLLRQTIAQVREQHARHALQSYHRCRAERQPTA